jgi:hypothetical protein
MIGFATIVSITHFYYYRDAHCGAAKQSKGRGKPTSGGSFLASVSTATGLPEQWCAGFCQ